MKNVAVISHNQGCRTKVNGFVACLFILLGLLSGCSSAEISAPMRTDLGILEICNQAQEMLVKGQPEKAVELIETSRTKFADSISKEENQHCDQIYKNAIYSVAVNSNKNAPLPGFPHEWSDSKEFWAFPPIGFGLSVIVGITAGVIISAFSAKISIFEIKNLNSRYLPLLGASGSILLVIGVTLYSILMSLAAIGRKINPHGLSVLVHIVSWLVIIGSITLLSFYLSNKMGLQITLRDRKGEIDQGKTSNLVVLIRNAGNQKSYKALPVKMENSTNLLVNSTVQGTPENRVVAVFQFVFSGLFGVSPWRVNVDELDDDSIVVIVTRNGRSRANVRVTQSFIREFWIGTDFHRKNAENILLYKVVAAVVIVTLSEHYSNFEDLCGASDWRSVGLQYIAASENSDEKRVALLRPAVEYDPENLIAQLMLQIASWRASKNGENVLLYAEWLVRHAQNGFDQDGNIKQGYERFYCVCIIHYLTAVRNLRNCQGFDRSHKKAIEEAWKLRDFLENMRARDLDQKSLLRMAEIAEIGVCLKPKLEQLRKLEDNHKENPVPVVLYNLSCVLLDHGSRLDNRQERVNKLLERALGYLRQSLIDPELKDWSRSDPVLVRVTDKLNEKHKEDLLGLIG